MNHINYFINSYYNFFRNVKFAKFKLLKNYLLYYFKGTHQGLNISHAHTNTHSTHTHTAHTHTHTAHTHTHTHTH